MASDLGVNGNAPVRVVQAADPVTEAARLAAELDADVALDADTAEAAVLARAEAGRLAASGDAGDDGAVLGRADAIRAAAAAVPPLTDDDVAELRRLAADISMAGRIRSRTEERVTEVLQARVASTSGVAVHPAALTSASEAVVAAEEALADAERSLLEHGSPPVDLGSGGARLAAEAAEAAAVDEQTVLTPLNDFDEARLVARRKVRTIVGVDTVAVLLVVAAIVAGLPVVAAVGFGVVVSVAVAIVVMRGGDDHAGEEEAADNLAVMAAALASTETARRVAALEGEDEQHAGADAAVEPPPEPEPEPEVAAAEAADPGPDPEAVAAMEAWVDWRTRLEAARDEAQELVRVARNRWHQLAGPDADPHDLDRAIQAHDPQLTHGPRALEASPSVRTVNAFHRRTQARWRVLWASLGYDEAPAPEQLDEVLDRLLAEHRAAADDLHRLAEAEARRDAAALVRRPLVLVQPRDWVAPGRLAQLLSSVPADGEVVLVERSEGAAVPQG